MATRYAMAMKRNTSSPAPGDWLDRLRGIPGVEVAGSTEHGAEFTATPEALEKIQAAFSPHFVIEEVRDRSLS
jgi:hypothetical protein